MKDINEFSLPLFKSFQQEDLILGVQKPILIGIMLVLVLVWYLFGTVPSLIITSIIYLPCYFVTKRDPHLLSIALNAVFLEPEVLEG